MSKDRTLKVDQVFYDEIENMQRRLSDIMGIPVDKKRVTAIIGEGWRSRSMTIRVIPNIKKKRGWREYGEITGL